MQTITQQRGPRTSPPTESEADPVLPRGPSRLNRNGSSKTPKDLRILCPAFAKCLATCAINPLRIISCVHSSG